MSTYRKQFSENHSYSFAEALPVQICIKNPLSSCNIFKARISGSIQGTQFVVVVYYNGTVDVYSLSNGKKINSVDISTFQSPNNIQLNHIYNMGVIGHSVFISTFDGSLLCYEGG